MAYLNRCCWLYGRRIVGGSTRKLADRRGPKGQDRDRESQGSLGLYEQEHPLCGAGARPGRFHTAVGRLDGVVNNAGGGRASAFRGLTQEKGRKTFRINLEAAVEVCQATYGIMRAQRSGSIVNMASVAAHGPGKWMGADYAASKAGLVSLTKSLAFEAARLGIRVNAISPGMVETDMTAVLPETMRKGLGIPMGRFATPLEIGTVTAFLLSESSNYITGQVLHVDGGLWMGNA